jgi:tetratricopeptide (TPR) repeat protein
MSTRWAATFLAFALVALMPSAATAQDAASRAAALATEGNRAFEEERFGDALDVFARAAKLTPRDANVHFAAGYAAARLGRLSEAVGWLTESLRLDPQSTSASIVLGQALYAQGKAREAVRVYEDAQRFAPDDDVLRRGIEEWAREAQLHGRFYEARGAHFSVIFEGPADDAAARRVVDMLEQAYWDIGRALSVYPTEPVPVILYTREQFRDITRSPDWADGFYDGRIRIPLAGSERRTEELRSLLEHEYVHAVVAFLGGSGVPAWLNEGLASVLESGGLEEADRALASDPRRLKFDRLTKGFGALPIDEAALAYAQSARAVKRMIDLRGAPAVVSLLQALGRGQRFESAFQQAIAMRFEDFVTMVSRE